MVKNSTCRDLPKSLEGAKYAHLLLGLAVVLSVVGFLLLEGYSDSLNAARITSRNLAITLETRLDATLRRSESILTQLTASLTEEQMTQQASSLHVDKIERELDLGTAHFPELAGLRIFDSKGILLYSSGRRNLVDRPHVEDRQFFQRLRDDPSATRVFSGTFKVRSTNTHSIGMAFPFRTKDGRFLGIALALINLDYFQSYLSTLDIGPQGIFAIRRKDDFSLVLRQPNLEAELNQGLPPGNPTRDAILEGKVQDTAEFVSKTDGVRRIFSIQTLQQYPYYVLVAIGRDDALSSWSVRTRLTIFSLLILLILIWYQQRRVRSGEASLQASINALRFSEQFSKTTLDAMPMKICVLDKQGQILGINQAWREFFDQNDPRAAHNNYYVGHFYNEAYLSSGQMAAADMAKLEQGLRDVQAGDITNFELEYSYGAPHEKRFVHAHVTSFGGMDCNLLISHNDISDRKSSEEELKLAASVFHNSAEGVVITDADSNILSVNPAFEEITGYTADEALGQKPSLLRSDRHGPEFYRTMWVSLVNEGSWKGEIWNRRKNGEAYLEWLTINRITDSAGATVRYVSVFHDITEMRRKDEHIRHQAFHDVLTGLPNRALFQERLQHALNRSRREGGRLSVTFIDLDGFKDVNDTLGHDVGDVLLQEVANRIRVRMRRGVDTVARLGGDEFVVLMEDLQEADVCACLASEIIADISTPFEHGGHELRVGASMGLAFYPEDGDSVQALMKCADTAMYAAKTAGKGTYRFFQASMLEEVTARLALEAELRSALKQHQFILHYQPQLDLRSGRIVGVEALVRWQHPKKGLIPPVEFIPVAEECGLIVPLGDWVLEEACRQMVQWRTHGLDDLRVSVNLSAIQFADSDLPLRIEKILEKTNMPSGALDLEVTESVAMNEPANAAAMMRVLTAQKLTLSIDDFGTGYSSLAYLKMFPISTLKIDRTFVKDIEVDPDDAGICEVTVLLAHKLGLDVVAEGVETAGQLKFLLSIGCEKVQGYLISKPLPADQAEEFIRNNLPLFVSGKIDLWAGLTPG